MADDVGKAELEWAVRRLAREARDMIESVEALLGIVRSHHQRIAALESAVGITKPKPEGIHGKD